MKADAGISIQICNKKDGISYGHFAMRFLICNAFVMMGFKNFFLIARALYNFLNV